MSDMRSALLRRYLGRQLQQLRKQAGLTQEEAAKRLERARATVGRMEEGHEAVRFRELEVKAMLDLYQVSDADRERVLALAAETRNGAYKGWWHDYTQTSLPEWFFLFVSLEDSADRIRQYEAELIPGLLQTRAYAEEVTRIPAGFNDDQEELSRRVKVRLERQSLLTRHRAPSLTAILNETVLRRPVGSPSVMAEQLRHLLGATERPNVIVRILPFAAGHHSGMVASAFTLLDFPPDPRGGEPLEPPLAYVDTLTGAMYLNKPDEFRAYSLAWEDLDVHALDQDRSREMITTAMKGFNGG